jgi:acyl-CoA thioesterase-2
MGDLDLDTRLQPVPGEPGHYTIRLSPDWEIWGPNGGYVAAVALRAAGLEGGFSRPAALSVHYLGVARFDEVQLEVVRLREARSACSLRVSMTQGDHPILEALVWVAKDDLAGYEHDEAAPPEVPAPGSLPKPRPPANFDSKQQHSFVRNLESRYIEPAESELGKPIVRQWVRFRPNARFGDPFVDAARSLVLIDTFGWSAASRPYTGRPYMAPSLDVQVRFHQPAKSDWLLSESRAPLATGGLIGTEVRVWDESGDLVASGGGQLLCRPSSQGRFRKSRPTQG